MIMKKHYLLLCLAAIISMIGCRKQENIDFKFDTELDYVPTELDRWLTETFTDPYNMEIIYRFDRYKMGELRANMVPPKEEKVEEQMKMIMQGFILPFKAAAGSTFAKTFLPKEWMLSGSFYIASDGTRILATSSGGRNISIYEVNTVDTTDGPTTRRKLKTVHHEFAHTLTQIIRIPREFESISEANYSASYASTSIWPDAKNDEQGFVSRYARSSVMEDFAETVGFLLVYGQSWYDNKVASVPKSGADILKQKEAIVVKFYRDHYNIDFRSLQAMILKYMKSIHIKEELRTFFFDQNLTVRKYKLSNAIYAKGFATVLQEFKNLAAKDAFEIQDFDITFSPNDMNSGALQLRLFAKKGTSLNFYDFTFNYQIDSKTNKISFVKLAQSTGSPTSNYSILMKYFLSTISNYFTSTPFVMDWSLSKPNLTYTDFGYYDTGGFYKENDRDNYIEFTLPR